MSPLNLKLTSFKDKNKLSTTRLIIAFIKLTTVKIHNLICDRKSMVSLLGSRADLGCIYVLEEIAYNVWIAA